MAKELQIDINGCSENRGLNDRVVAIDDRHVGIKLFNSFRKDIFLNVKKFFDQGEGEKQSIDEHNMTFWHTSLR